MAGARTRPAGARTRRTARAPVVAALRVARGVQRARAMPLRHRRFARSEASPIRSAVNDVADAVRTVLGAWIAPLEHAEPLRRALAALRRDVSLAVVLLDEPERDVPSVVEASRAAAIRAALRVNACLASAYQERWAPPRAVLAACHAIARLIEALQTPPPRVVEAVPRWN